MALHASTGLEIRALGGLQVRLNGRPLIGSGEQRRELMLVYLAEHHEPQPRLKVARMLWPQSEDDLALTSLRTLLRRMRQEGLEAYLQIERTTVALNPKAEIVYDAAVFRAAIAQSNTEVTTDALDLYSGAFLQGVQFRGVEGLEEWALATERTLERHAINGLQRLAQKALATGDVHAAVRFAQRLLDIAPYDDAQHVLYMHALAHDNRQAEALRHYEDYRQTLQLELGLHTASPELTEFAEDLRAGAIVQPTAHASTRRDEGATAPNADKSMRAARLQPATRLVGREQELAALEQLVIDEHARLITIVGLGGMGKTHLLQELGARLQQHFDGDVLLIDLTSEAPPPDAPCNASTELLARILAREMGIRTAGSDEQAPHLFAEMQSRHCCLLIDNFEQFLPAAALLSRLLTSIPRATLIVTSRARLNLSGETIFELDGLGVPSSDALDDVSRSSAVKLYLEAVRRHQRGYKLTAQNAAYIAEICRRVDGMPLAMLIIAGWSYLLAPDAILEELKYNPTILTSSAADIPARQRDLTTVIASSWAQLPESERRVLMQLSLFAHGFDWAAVTTVTGASLADLHGLVRHALLTVTTPGRYSIHPLVRQFAQSKLDADTAMRAQAEAAHADHYWTWFVTRMQTDRDADELTHAYANLRLALAWYLNHDPETLLVDFSLLVRFWSARAQLSEARYWLTQLLAHAPDMSRVQADLMRELAMFAQQQQDFAESEHLALRALDVYASVEVRSGEAACMELLGWLMFDQPQRRGEALSWFNASRNLVADLDEPQSLSRLSWAMASCFFWSDMSKADPYLDEAAILAEQYGDVALARTIALSQLELAVYRGDLACARQFYADVKRHVDRECEDYNSTWVTLALATLARLMGELDDSEQYARRAYRNFEEMYAPRGRIQCTLALGDIARTRRRYDEAEALYDTCLEEQAIHHDDEVMIESLYGLAKLHLQRGNNEKAIELAAGADAIVGRVPLAVREPVRVKLKTLLTDLRALVSEATFATKSSHGRAQWDAPTNAAKAGGHPPHTRIDHQTIADATRSACARTSSQK